MNKRSKYWDDMCDILDECFPKGECKERGKALVLVAQIEMLLLGVKPNSRPAESRAGLSLAAIKRN